jgi:hypothetical protein
MPECRIDLFAEATDYDPIVIIGEIAHAAGAADDGPRPAPEMPVPERNGYDNLLLLCQNCHARVDGQTGFNTVEHLKDIKAAHEAWVRASLPERGRSRTGWTALALRGDHPIDLATISGAVAPDFVVDEPLILQLPAETDDWLAVDRTIAAAARKLLAEGDPFERRLAVFPLAPVSALLSLGYHLTSRPHLRLFQYHRDERTWAWARRAAPAQDIVVTGLEGPLDNIGAVTFAFHYSATITDDALIEAGASFRARVDIRVPEPTTGWLQHPDQLTWAALAARRAFERATQLFPKAKLWHFFYAGPAPLGVAIGQQVNPTMYPPIQLYEYRHKDSPRYRASICLGG